MEKSRLHRAETLAMAILSLGELAMGLLYYFVTLLQQVGSVWFLVLQHLFFTLHFVCLVLALVLALMRGHRMGAARGLLLLSLFHLALSLKDMVGNLVSNLVFLSGYYTVGESLLLALIDTLANTVFAQGIAFLVLYFGMWLLFLKKKQNQEIPLLPFSPKKDVLSLSAALIAGLLAVVDLVTRLVEFVDFGRSNFWLLTVGELLLGVLDLLMPLVAGILAYLAAWWMRKCLARHLS